LSYFYLLEGSKIFFMSTKYCIWIVSVPVYLWEFSWKFCDFRSIFRAFRQFLVFAGIVFALKIISENKRNSSFPPGPSPKVLPAPALAQPSARPNPIEARQSRPGQARHGQAAASRRPCPAR
jgi:hypothetical protein